MACSDLRALRQFCALRVLSLCSCTSQASARPRITSSSSGCDSATRSARSGNASRSFSCFLRSAARFLGVSVNGWRLSLLNRMLRSRGGAGRLCAPPATSLHAFGKPLVDFCLLLLRNSVKFPGGRAISSPTSEVVESSHTTVTRHSSFFIPLALIVKTRPAIGLSWAIHPVLLGLAMSPKMAGWPMYNSVVVACIFISETFVVKRWRLGAFLPPLGVASPI